MAELNDPFDEAQSLTTILTVEDLISTPKYLKSLLATLQKKGMWTQYAQFVVHLVSKIPGLDDYKCQELIECLMPQNNHLFLVNLLTRISKNLKPFDVEADAKKLTYIFRLINVYMVFNKSENINRELENYRYHRKAQASANIADSAADYPFYLEKYFPLGNDAWLTLMQVFRNSDIGLAVKDIQSGFFQQFANTGLVRPRIINTYIQNLLIELLIFHDYNNPEFLRDNIWNLGLLHSYLEGSPNGNQSLITHLSELIERYCSSE